MTSANYQPRHLAASVNHSFAALPAPNLPRSKFNLSHKRWFTARQAQLIPIFWDEILPSDTVSITPKVLARLLTAKYPTMDNLYIDWHAFFVPNRLVWDNWQKFMGERENPDDSIDYTIPVLMGDSSGNDWKIPFGGLADKFGFPCGQADYGPYYSGSPDDPSNPTCLLHRGYRLIWNQWYRNQNLQDSVTVSKGDGPDYLPEVDQLLARNKRPGYFTSALPWPQKGDAVYIPLGTEAPVVGTGAIGLWSEDAPTIDSFSMGAYAMDVGGVNKAILAMADASVVGSNTGTPFSPQSPFNTSQKVGLNPDGTKSGVVAVLSEATAITVNALRELITVQQMLEEDARGGTRYNEILFRQFGSLVPDFRLQRPEFLGGGTSPIVMTAIADTASDLGELGGVAVGGINGNITYSAVEHGHIFVLASVRADITFQNRLDRRLTRKTRFDYYRHEMAHLGEQPIKNREIGFAGYENGDGIWAYQERWAEYRYMDSVVTSEFRSNHPQSLDAWHYAIDYEGQTPEFNGSFMVDDPPIDRTVLVNGPQDPIFKFECAFDYYNTRVLPVYSIPGLERL